MYNANNHPELNAVMIKRRFNAAFLFLLLAAFMVFKWTPSHAHLNAQHDHSGEQHRHSVEAHAHQPVAFHADPIDSDHPQMDVAEVVDLDQEQLPQNDKKLDNPATLAAYVYSPPLVQTRGVGLPEKRDFLPRLLYPHTGQPRAPPQLS